MVEWCNEEALTVNPLKTTIVNFTKKKRLTGLKPIALNGVVIPYALEAKYLGVIFDHKLTWNQHIQKITQKSTVSFNICRKMCGKNWGLNPKMTLWLYTRVIRPMITYGAIAWWPKTQQAGVTQLLGAIQRQACLSATGAMKTTPTRAIEVLLNLPPLPIFIQGEARAVACRLSKGQQPISKLHGAAHLKQIEELENDQILGMPSDRMLLKYSFEKNFKVNIHDRDTWKEGPPIQAEIAWYTDGSKTNDGVGAGIYGTKPKTRISLSLGKHATVFQAEVAAIHTGATELIRQEFVGKTIAIYSDSQAAIKAVNSMQVDSRLVWDCLEALNELGSRNRLSLAWVPGHKGYRGNEEADQLARQGASTPLNGPEPFCGISKSTTRAHINKWMLHKSQEWWHNTPALRQAKEFIKGPSPKIADYLLSQNRRTTRIIVGLLTGHCRLNKHMKALGLAEDTLCRFCMEEEETAVHVLCHCEGLSRLRFLILGEEKPRARSYTQEPLSRLWSLVTKTKLDEVL